MSRSLAPWVRTPKYPEWKFEKKRPEILKINIDLRPSSAAPQRIPSGVMSEQSPHQRDMFQHNIFATRAPSQEQRQVDRPPLLPQFHDENQRSGSSNFPPKHIHQFGNDSGAAYFGGPMINLNAYQWQETYHTRANGDVVGPAMSMSIITNQIIRSCAVMCSADRSQSGIWVGPRILLSTLHLHQWAGLRPTDAELGEIRTSRQTFEVETEICSKVLSQYSPKVRLIGFCAMSDLGVFCLLDAYPSRVDFIDPKLLIERDEYYQLHPSPGERVACVGFNGSVNEEETEKVRKQALEEVQQNLQRAAALVAPIDLDVVAKPGMKSFSPGTIDKGEARTDFCLFGVSCPLWKGSSGGPCIVLGGNLGGSVIGLVQGFDSYSNPYNIVNGFPNGLKDVLQTYNSEASWAGSA